jgi:hypothetical protein
MENLDKVDEVCSFLVLSTIWGKIMKVWKGTAAFRKSFLTYTVA